jgi:hypothetical protein
MPKSSLFVLGCLLLSALSACTKTPPKLTEEQAAVASFKRTAEDFLRAYKLAEQESDAAYHGTRFEVSSSSVDVQKTNSLVSPYIGVLEFDVGDPTHAAQKHRHTYAYQSGTWVLQSAKQHFPSDDDWWNCYDEAELKLLR